MRPKFEVPTLHVPTGRSTEYAPAESVLATKVVVPLENTSAIPGTGHESHDWLTGGAGHPELGLATQGAASG
jgi:hypothetical protein